MHLISLLQWFKSFRKDANEFEFPVLNESDKIIILADEAHRTQYGTLGAAINTALPNAPRIAFTGTPLIKVTKDHQYFRILHRHLYHRASS